MALRSIFSGTSVIFLCGLFSNIAAANDDAALPEWILSAGVPLLPRFEENIPTWSTTLLLSASLTPRYAGSNALRAQALPLFDIRYKDWLFISAIEGLGINLSQSKNYRVGVAVNYASGRSPSDAPILKSTASIRSAAEVKVFADYVIFPVVLRTDVRHTINGYSGYVIDGAAYVPLTASDRFVMFAGVSATWGTRSYMQDYFSITPADSVASVLPSYQSAGGLRSAGLGVNATWNISKHWLIDGAFGAQRFGNHAYESPLTQTRIETSSTLSVGYTF